MVSRSLSFREHFQHLDLRAYQPVRMHQEDFLLGASCFISVYWRHCSFDLDFPTSFSQHEELAVPTHLGLCILNFDPTVGEVA